MVRQTEPATPKIDAILAALPVDQRSALQTLREQIAAAAPEAEEAMSYGAPAFRYRGHPLVSYGAARQHCAFYVMSGEVIGSLGDAIAGFDTAKGTIRFTREQPLTAELVTRVVQARMVEIEQRWG